MPSPYGFLREHDSFGKPESTRRVVARGHAFPDHALGQSAAAPATVSGEPAANKPLGSMRSWEGGLQAATREPGDLLPATSHAQSRRAGCSGACRMPNCVCPIGEADDKADALTDWTFAVGYFRVFSQHLWVPFGIAWASPFRAIAHLQILVFLIIDRARHACRPAPRARGAEGGLADA